MSAVLPTSMGRPITLGSWSSWTAGCAAPSAAVANVWLHGGMVIASGRVGAHYEVVTSEVVLMGRGSCRPLKCQQTPRPPRVRNVRLAMARCARPRPARVVRTARGEGIKRRCVQLYFLR